MITNIEELFQYQNIMILSSILKVICLLVGVSVITQMNELYRFFPEIMYFSINIDFIYLSTIIYIALLQPRVDTTV